MLLFFNISFNMCRLIFMSSKVKMPGIIGIHPFIIESTITAQNTPDYGKAKEKLLEVAAKRNPDLDDSEIAEDQTIIDVIDKERKLELVQEGHRFFDARRLGKIISVADGAYTNFNIAKCVDPIPSFEVNSGFGVIQTEGWSDNLPR